MDNADYAAMLKLGIENDENDKLRYYDKLINVYKHKKNETEWKKLELKKNDTECYELLAQANKTKKEEEKYIANNKKDKGTFTKEEIEKIIAFKKSRKNYYNKIINKALNPSLKSLAERSKKRVEEELVQAISAL